MELAKRSAAIKVETNQELVAGPVGSVQCIPPRRKYLNNSASLLDGAGF
jgi:hypothetical protein